MKDRKTYLKTGLLAALMVALAMTATGASAQEVDSLAVVHITGSTGCSPLTNECEHSYNGHHSSAVPGIGGSGMLIGMDLPSDQDSIDGCEWPDRIPEIIGCTTHVEGTTPIGECTEWWAGTTLWNFDERSMTHRAPASACF